MFKCNDCGHEWTKDFGHCPHCDSENYQSDGKEEVKPEATEATTEEVDEEVEPEATTNVSEQIDGTSDSEVFEVTKEATDEEE